MSVHYKFKSTLNFDTITFDGLHISVADLKKEIVQQKRLGKVLDFDLQITNAQNKEEYKDDNFLIPKNTTLIISRIPIAHPVKKGWDTPSDNAISTAPTSKPDNLNMDLFKMSGSEEDKIQAMMMQSTADYDPKTYHRIKGQSQVGEVPASYRCNKCKRGGHWIKNCSFPSEKGQVEVKRNTGIPRSFRDKPEISIEQEPSNYISSNEKDQEIPEDLICGICRNIFVDAVMIPCCGSSFCDDCVRTSLLESEDSECPDCKEKNCSPGSLIPNRFLRNSVNVFKNETGIRTFKSVNKSSTAEEIKDEPTKAVDETNQAEESEQGDTQANNTEEETNLPINIINNTNISKNEKDKFDSDYEDNITIKMPPKLSETTITDKNEQVSPIYSQKPLGGNDYINRREMNIECKSDIDIKQPPYSKNEGLKHPSERSLLPTPVGSHHKYQNLNMNEHRDKSVINPDPTHRMGMYNKPAYMQMHRCPTMLPIPPYNNGYNNIAHRPLMSFGGHYPSQPLHQMPSSYIPPGNMNLNPSQTFQSTNLASIYQGVAAKVGTGLIDDPLEAFNRIMKEKEKQKVDRRRSPGHHRSRSPGRLRHRFKSPMYDRDTSREINTKEKRGRSRERKRDYSYERRQSRVARRSSNGSNSPSDKKKRYVQRRSPSPKSGYKPRLREKSLTRPVGPKTDTVEPPPPGFESLQIESIADIDNNRNDRQVDPDISKNADDHLSRKRQRTHGKNEDVRTIENICRSLTPPTKSKIPKVSRMDYTEMHESSPKTPDRREKDFQKVEKNQSAQFLNSENNTVAAKSYDRLESNSDMGKENNMKVELQLKDRKKKKKVKSERKKSKKDKKEKKDKNKKGHSQSIEPTPEKMLSMNVNMDVCNENIEGPSIHLTKTASDSIDLERKEPTVSIESTDRGFNRDNVSLKHNEVSDVQISKWELDDNNLNNILLDPCRIITCNQSQEQSEITSDVIRKAENAIFAKAINAIRPVEFKVVLDSKRSSKDPSSSSKSNHKDRSHSPKSVINKSVKERLGNKVVSERRYSSDRSKSNRGENSGKNYNDDRYKHNSVSSSSREKHRTSKDRIIGADRKFQDHRYRKSSEREIIKVLEKDSKNTESNKYTSQFKEKASTIVTKSEKRNYESDRSAYRSGETRLNSTITSRPSRPVRPDNPFRKFDDNISSSNTVPKFDNSSKRDISTQSPDHSEHKKRKDKKVKKLKSLKKCSSSESIKSEKRKDEKSKKKNKLVKKKKKSRK